MDLVNVVPPRPHLDEVTGFEGTSLGSGGSGSHMGLSWTRFLWSPSGLTWNTMTLIHIWTSPGPVDSDPYLGIIGTWILSYIPRPLLDLVTVVPPRPHLDEVTGFQGNSPGPGDSGPHMGIMGHGFSVPHRGLTWT